MGKRVQRLYDLQKVDLEIDEAEKRLRLVESRLGESEEIRSTREVLAEARERQAQLQRRLRTLELDLEEVLEKIKEAEGALYGGGVKSPKELAGLQQEVQILKRRQREVEDEVLEVMGEVEEAEQETAGASKRWEESEKHWQEEQALLKEQGGELRSRLSLLREKRGSLQEGIDPEDLSIYEDLRRRKGGEGVVLVKEGVCQGCGVALPTSKVPEVRHGEELVHCANCERILHLKG